MTNTTTRSPRDHAAALDAAWRQSLLRWREAESLVGMLACAIAGTTTLVESPERTSLNLHGLSESDSLAAAIARCNRLNAATERLRLAAVSAWAAL